MCLLKELTDKLVSRKYKVGRQDDDYMTCSRLSNEIMVRVRENDGEMYLSICATYRVAVIDDHTYLQTHSAQAFNSSDIDNFLQVLDRSI